MILYSLLFSLTILNFSSLTLARSYLRANGNSGATYAQLDKFFGHPAEEVPDCGHPGHHVTQRIDSDLNIPVFVFASHVNNDNDRCIKYDRQRTEVRPDKSGPKNFLGFSGDKVSYSWDLRLNSAFQPSSKFTHLHQLKAVGGDDSQPIITISPRQRNSSRLLEIIYTPRQGGNQVIWSDQLSKYTGRWIHIVEEATYGSQGFYFIKIKVKSTNQELMTLSRNFDMWRDGTNYVRPKWGIYRSILEKNLLRDEYVYVNNFCLAKNNNNEEKCT